MESGGGGGSLSPLLILLLVLTVQLADRFLELLKKGPRSDEDLQLQQEIKQLLKEAGSLSTPATFAQAAKLRRLAAAKQKELTRRQDEDAREKKSSQDQYAKVLMISKVVLFSSLIWRFWSRPIASVPPQLLQPFGRIFSWRAADAATGQVTIGIIPWLVLTYRVAKFLCQKLTGSLFPG